MLYQTIKTSDLVTSLKGTSQALDTSLLQCSTLGLKCTLLLFYQCSGNVISNFLDLSNFEHKVFSQILSILQYLQQRCPFLEISLIDGGIFCSFPKWYSALTHHVTLPNTASPTNLLLHPPPVYIK